MKRLLILIPILLLFVPGCTTTEGNPNPAATVATNAPPVEEGVPDPGEFGPADPSPAGGGAPASPEAQVSVVVKVGQPYTWTDGVTAIVTKIEDGNLSPQAYPRGGPAKIVEIQVQNRSGATLTTYGTPYLRFGPAGYQAESATDYESGIEGFQGSIAPGQTATAKYAFIGVTDASTMTVEFAPSLNHQPAFWTVP
jgi:hypothetical protein